MPVEIGIREDVAALLSAYGQSVSSLEGYIAASPASLRNDLDGISSEMSESQLTLSQDRDKYSGRLNELEDIAQACAEIPTDELNEDIHRVRTLVEEVLANFDRSLEKTAKIADVEQQLRQRLTETEMHLTWDSDEDTMKALAGDYLFFCDTIRPYTEWRRDATLREPVKELKKIARSGTNSIKARVSSVADSLRDDSEKLSTKLMSNIDTEISDAHLTFYTDSITKYGEYGSILESIKRIQGHLPKPAQSRIADFECKLDNLQKAQAEYLDYVVSKFSSYVQTAREFSEQPRQYHHEIADCNPVISGLEFIISKSQELSFAKQLEPVAISAHELLNTIRGKITEVERVYSERRGVLSAYQTELGAMSEHLQFQIQNQDRAGIFANIARINEIRTSYDHWNNDRDLVDEVNTTEDLCIQLLSSVDAYVHEHVDAAVSTIANAKQAIESSPSDNVDGYEAIGASLQTVDPAIEVLDQFKEVIDEQTYNTNTLAGSEAKALASRKREEYEQLYTARCKALEEEAAELRGDEEKIRKLDLGLFTEEIVEEFYSIIARLSELKDKYDGWRSDRALHERIDASLPLIDSTRDSARAKEEFIYRELQQGNDKLKNLSGHSFETQQDVNRIAKVRNRFPVIISVAKLWTQKPIIDEETRSGLPSQISLAEESLQTIEDKVAEYEQIKNHNIMRIETTIAQFDAYQFPDDFDFSRVDAALEKITGDKQWRKYDPDQKKFYLIDQSEYYIRDLLLTHTGFNPFRKDSAYTELFKRLDAGAKAALGRHSHFLKRIQACLQEDISALIQRRDSLSSSMLHPIQAIKRSSVEDRIEQHQAYLKTVYEYHKGYGGPHE